MGRRVIYQTADETRVNCNVRLRRSREEQRLQRLFDYKALYKVRNQLP